MATTVVVYNQTYKRRNPFAVWLGLPLITLGIYYFVWWYKINNEARRFLNDPSITPGVSVLAVTVGALIVVPPFVSAYNTTGRIARMQERAGVPAETRAASPWISVLLHFVFGAHALYMQMELNRIWDGYARPGMVALPPPAPPPPPPPV